MKNTQAGIATIALIVIVAIAMITAGTYAYTKVSQKGKAADELISSAQRSLEQSSRPISEIVAELSRTQGALQREISRFDLFRSTSYNPASPFGQVLASIQNEIADNVITKTESIFKLVTEAGIDASIKVSLTQDRQELIALVQAWQNALNSSTNSTQLAVSTAAQAALAAAEQYANSLQQAVNSLTPQNSTLTQTEIATQQTVVETVTNTVSNSSNGANAVIPDPVVIQELEDDIEDLQDELAIATSTPSTPSTPTGTGGSTGSGSDGGTGTGGGTGDQTGDTTTYTPPPYVPPPVIDRTGQPTLIQGANPL
jgi:hypothetical protein